MTNNRFHADKWHIIRTRAAVIREVRLFFENAGFTEFDAPLMTPYPSLDANISSFKVDWHLMNGSARDCFLHSSPEHAMKKVLAAAESDLFFCGKVFRDFELTDLHNPEFTMAEWYRKNADYQSIMADTENLVHSLAVFIHGKSVIRFKGMDIDLSIPWDRMSIRELFLRHCQMDLHENKSLSALQNAASSSGIYFDASDDWETLFFRLMMEKIEPLLDKRRPVFVYDYPAEMGLMAKRKDAHPEWVERVELYIGGMECANGYSELTDWKEQKNRFLHEQKKLKDLTGRKLPVDCELIEALKQNLPPCSGMALGLDRIIMLLLDADHIRKVLPFAFHEWTGEE